ncbi:MAG: hypothetical protein QOE86_2447, partial [Solirubrobacteraceae bacterium]|nr:hypothetical protein [Solirubrobacteraceae bacterium]
GRPTHVEHGYVGLVVHEAARICSAAHGGQVLLSAAVARAVDDRSGGRVSVLDLGEHVLKDIAQPVALCQLILDGLPERFPPLRTAGAPTNLALPATPLFGRDAEMDSIVAALEGNSRLVTLTGPGGTGKTRLAQEVAWRMLPATAGGVFFVSLVSVADDGGILPAVGDAIGLREGASATADDPVVHYLQGRRALVVLDNLEHLDGAARPVGVLLDRCPGVSILATSRAPLRLRAEQQVPVTPLAVGDAEGPGPAVQLFVERAVATDPTFAARDAELEAVVELCRRLDGLPLAIELAAARVRMLRPVAMLGRLRSSLALLSRGPHDLPERHRSLEATIAWSHELLDDPERRLLERLAVMPGGWTLDAAQALAADLPDLDSLDAVQTLVEYSLAGSRTSRGGEQRFSMLQTVREFALSRLRRRGDEQQACRRRAEFHAELVQAEVWEFHGPGQDVAIARMGDELDNIRATVKWTQVTGERRLALRLAACLWYFMEARGAMSEARDWLTAALTASTEPSSDRVLALCGACILAAMQGRHTEAEPFAGELERLTPGIADPIYRVRATMALGLMASERGDLQQSRRLFGESATLARGLNDHLAAISLSNLGDAAMRDGQFDEAAAVLATALDLSRRTDNPHGIGFALTNLATVHVAQNQFAQAEREFGDALPVGLRLDDRLNVVSAIGGLGWTAAIHEPERAARLLGWAERQRERFDLTVTGLELTVEADAVTQVRAMLDHERFDSCWGEGRQMTFDDAVTYARRQSATDALMAAL